MASVTQAASVERMINTGETPGYTRSACSGLSTRCPPQLEPTMSMTGITQCSAEGNIERKIRSSSTNMGVWSVPVP